MSNIKNYLYSFGITCLLIFSSVIFINVFYYFNLMNESIYRFFKIISIIINIFLGGFFLGKRTNYKGYQTGLVFGLMIISILFILSIIFSNLQIKLILYYLVIITSSCLGGTIGIRKKKKH